MHKFCDKNLVVYDVMWDIQIYGHYIVKQFHPCKQKSFKSSPTVLSFSLIECNNHIMQAFHLHFLHLL